MEPLNILFPRIGIESTTCPLQSRTFMPLRHEWLQVDLPTVFIFFQTA